MKYKIIKVPGKNDCFFHVIAYFTGSSPTNVDAAQLVRHNMAHGAAYYLFQPPYNDLKTLTNLVLSSTKPEDLSVVKFQVTEESLRLQNLFNDGPFVDMTNGGGCPLAAFVVWFQYSRSEIKRIKDGSQAQWLRNARRFLSFTIWGDNAFAARLVQLCFNRTPRFYIPGDIDDVDKVEKNVVNFYHKIGSSHFDAIEFFEDDDFEDDSFFSPYPSPDNLNLEIHHLDVSQGDSTLIVIREGEMIRYSVLVDGGEANHAGFIHEYMNRIGIKLLDGIAITHYDADHCRGVIELLANSAICQNAWVFDRGEPDDVDTDTKINDALIGKLLGKEVEMEEDRMFDDEVEELKILLKKTAKNRVTAGKRGKSVVGEKLFEFCSEDRKTILSMTCIAGNGYVLDGTYVEPKHKDKENARSLSFLIRFNEFTYFLGGDSPGTPENDLEGAIAECLTGHLGLEHICSFKVDHHGSHHSTHSDFVDTFGSSCAFISCGDHKKHRHPRQEPITVLEKATSVKNFFLTRCIFQREHITPHNKIQMGKSRVAGSEDTMGTIVLRVDHSMTCYHIFHVGYWDRECGLWRLMRFSCEESVSEEVWRKTDYEHELIVHKCSKEALLKEEVIVIDAITRYRAKFDEKVVRSFGIKFGERDARRCMLEGTEEAVEYIPKTIETKEMLIELDKKTDKEIRRKEKKRDKEDEDYMDDSNY